MFGKQISNMNKFQIKKIDDRTMTIEVLQGNKVVLERKFLIDLGLKLDLVKEKLRQEVQLMEVREEEKLRLENKKKDFIKLIGKKLEL